MARRYLLGAALLGCAAAIPAEFVQGSLQAVHETAPSAADSVHATSLLASKPASNFDKSECLKTVPPIRAAYAQAWDSKNATLLDSVTDPRLRPGYDHLLLIARYDEPLDWVVSLLESHKWIQNVLIINKGTPILAPLPKDRVRIRQANNVGREGETLLHYIVQDYDRLPERVWFLQGEPQTHAPHIERLFDPDIVQQYHLNFQPLTKQFAEYARIPDRLLTGEEEQLAGMVRQVYITVSNGGIVFANGVNEDDSLARKQGVFGFTNIIDAMQKEHKVEDRDETIRHICKYLNMSVPVATDSLIPYTMSAMFYVSGAALKTYPKEFYEGVRKWLIYDDPTGREPLEAAPGGTGVDTCNYLRQAGRRGFLLERLWQFMFTGTQTRLKKAGASSELLGLDWPDVADAK